MRKLIASGLLFASMLVASQAAGEEALTAKERSSRKWFDEQRIDNCRIPPELRGSTPRPGCRDEGATASRTPATR
jgi:hypothetical protein